MTVVCPGCGLELPAGGHLPGGRHNCSAECWALFGELSGYTLAHGHSTFIHQHAVDTWQLQHALASKSNIGIAFSLIGLHLALEKGYTGRQVQLTHMALGKIKRYWGDFEIPKTRAALTVRDVLDAPPGPKRDERLMEWARAVWSNWPHSHAWTRDTYVQLLNAR